MLRRATTWCVQQIRSPKSLVRIGALSAVLGAMVVGGWNGLVIENHRGAAASGSDSLLTNAGPAGKLVLLSGTTHDFGVMDQEKQGTHEFEIKNDGPGDLVLELLDKSCGCTSVKVNGRAMEFTGTDFLGLPPLPPLPQLSMLETLDGKHELNSHQLASELPQADLNALPTALPRIEPNEQHANLNDPTTPQLPTHENVLHAPASAEPHVIRAGEKAVVELTWDTGTKVGQVRQYVRIGTSDPNQPLVDFAIEGEVVPVVAISENPIRIPIARSDKSSSATFRIFSTVSNSLNPTLLNSSNPLVIARFEPLAEDVQISLKAKSGFEGTIELAAGQAIGPFHAELLIATNVPARPELRVQVVAQVEGSVIVVPADKLDFQLVPHGTSRTLNILIKPRGDEPVNVKVAAIAPGFLHYEVHAFPSSNGSHGLTVVEVSVPAGSPNGPFVGSIKLETISRSSGLIEIPVRGLVSQNH